MSKPTASHPDQQCLLQYGDGELSHPAAAEVRAHLDACPQCRSELAELQSTVQEFARYRQRIPAPPASLAAFERRLDRLIAERQTRPRPRWFALAAAAAAVAAACFVAVELRHPATVSAAELLRQASEKEIAAPRRPRRLQIRDSAQRSEAELRALFAGANYHADDPLSATAFRAWHDSLADRRDEVVDRAGVYRIRTDTRSSDLEEAVLNLRAGDLGVVSGSFRFRSQELVELTALPDEAVAPVEQTAPKPAAEAAPNAATASANPAEELRVLAALHRAGADLGEQIDVSRDSAGHWTVTATGLAAGRRAAIENSLSALPAVTLRFQQPTIDLSKSTEAAGSRSAAPEVPGAFERQLQAALGGVSELSNFTDQMLELSEAAMVQAHDLRNLATRFSPDLERQLDANDLSTLAQLRREHVQALAEKTGGLETRMAPVLAALGVPVSQPIDLPAAANWQAASDALFAATQHLDKMVTTLLTGGSADRTTDIAPATDRALKQLIADIDWYRQRY